MKRENSNRIRIVGLRLTPLEYAELEKRFRSSTCRKLSDHIRRHLFNKPIVTTYRNASFDDYIEETMTLNSELNSIGSNVNQIAKKMNSLKMISELKNQLIDFEIEKLKLFVKMEEIKIHSQKFSEQWLQL
ncbi:plasmid mobilization protein [Flavobacterium plurextorum]